MFTTACADCHSNQTKILWFEHAAPVEWYVASHVKDGRHALNIDTWHTYAGEGADESAKVIRKGSMPPSFYTYLGLHGDAKLTPAERQELHDGLAKTLAADPPKQ
ncbi:MAG TPA: heme-binding domain-containing protein [Rhodoglobus sp.]|nr:heme-binding domain-containing protein [Rhodoglobus sp.]